MRNTTKVNDKIRLRGVNCKTKTKNETKLTGFQNPKNKISEPTIVTGSTKVILESCYTVFYKD